MLSTVRKHIISQILGKANNIKLSEKTLASLFALGKNCNEGVEFFLSKDFEKIFGVELQTSKIRTDSILLKVTEVKSSNNQNKSLCFFISQSFFMNTLFAYKSNLDASNSDEKEHVLVEFSSPNIAKPFHIGHLRSTIVGNFVANCAKEKFGKVTRLNYLGDWGTQIGFVKVGLENFSKEQLKADPIRVLYSAYVSAHSQPESSEKAKQIFSDLEYDSCLEQISFWEDVRRMTISNLVKTYKDLGITFDEYCYESDYRISKIKNLLEDLLKRGIAKKRSLDGLLVYCPSSSSEIPLVREDGTSLYLSRDIAAAVDRITKYLDCSKIFYVVDKSQKLHFENVAKAVSSFTGKDVVRHIPFGRVTGVSSRKGTTLLLQDILDKAVEKMAEQQAESENTRSDDLAVTRLLAMTALQVYILRQFRIRDFVFNWDIALQGKGDTGVKLQYTHCRLCSLEENCGVTIPFAFKPELIREPLLVDVLIEVARSDEVIHYSIENFESSSLLNYMFKLCNKLSRCLSKIPVKGQPLPVAEQRLLVYHKARCTLSRCMTLIGLKPLERM